LGDDEVLAGIAIDRRGVHLRRRPTRLAVAGEERGQPLWPLAIDDPAYEPAEVPTIISASDGASTPSSNRPWKKPQYQAR
jgi:hypothetical protein